MEVSTACWFGKDVTLIRDCERRGGAGGFRDFTRIASSDPTMWRDIALANRPALLEAIDQFSQHLEQLRVAVEGEDADELFATFSRAKTARDAFAAVLAERVK